MTSTIGVGQSDARGAFLADHTVALDRSDPEYDAFVNLYDHIQWHRVPNRPLDSEAEIIERLGRWVGGKVLGSIGPKLVAAANDLPRALQRALTEALPEHPHPGASPISVAVPALFGARATDLVLEAPMRGEMPAEASPEASMARFPPESEYFVGRVGAMARASKAMAKASDYTGVLFHGMAGGGKTACALELAYRYEHDRFEYFVWYKAPEEGRAIDNALSDLAQDMEQQIPDFSMAHVIDRTEWILDTTWELLWQTLGQGSECPELQILLDELVVVGLVEVLSTKEETHVLNLHPGVAEAGRRESGETFQAKVDEVMGFIWRTLYDRSIEQETDGLGNWVREAPLHAAPYLMRQKQWSAAGELLERVLARDFSPTTASMLLPWLRQIAAATKGTDEELFEHLSAAGSSGDAAVTTVRNEAEELLRIEPDEHQST